MTMVVDHIASTLRARGLNLTKAYPRGTGHLTLQLADRNGIPVAGQWFADPELASVVAEQTERRTGGVVPVPVLDRRVVVQHAGADRAVPSLHGLAFAPGSTLVAHRAERRGMVRRSQRGHPATYTKALRPRRTSATVRRATLDIDGVEVPRVIASDVDRGLVTFEALPGARLLDLLTSPETTADQLRHAGEAVGEALARLHRTPAPGDLGVHDALAELEVTRTWVELARRYGVLDSRVSVRAHLGRLRSFAASTACRPTLVHRDLHDKQVLIGDAGTVGVLDLDLATAGEPALDLANLLVHLELRAVQGRCPTETARACARAVVDGYAPDPETWHRVPGYARATQLRLAAVYSFRPGSAWIGPTLLSRGLPGLLAHREVLA